ncbi:MAG: glycoside hydrolase family 43 protein [Bacteroidales bacterium]
MRYVFALNLLLLPFIMYACLPEKENSSATERQFTNPIGDGADPWVIRVGENYWYCGSMDDKIFLASASFLPDILKSERIIVFSPPANTSYSKEIWAPELHYVRGTWYIYFAADDGDNRNHRMYVLRGGTDPSNPLSKPFEFRGKVSDTTDKWAIDGTIFEYRQQLYLVWSGWPGDSNVKQCLYIAKMSDYKTISSGRVCISCPEFDWETIGDPDVNEGPEVIVHDSLVYIFYSASGSWTDDYCLGLLTNSSGDMLNIDAWKKTGPVFKKTEKVFAPGHASFLQTPNGRWWIIYHAAKYQGAGWDRNVRIQPFEWDGIYPQLGNPIEPGVFMNFP